MDKNNNIVAYIVKIKDDIAKINKRLDDLHKQMLEIMPEQYKQRLSALTNLHKYS